MGAALLSPVAVPPNATIVVQFKENGAKVEWSLRDPGGVNTTEKSILCDFVKELFTAQGYQAQRQTPIGGTYTR